MKDSFSKCHPAVNFLFYTGAIVMGMCYHHPVFLGCSVILSLAYYICIKRQWFSYMASMMGIWMVVAVINPLFNTRGETVLFTYLEGRAFTWEALCYGIGNGAIFITTLTWFATYHDVMTSDKFLYCFGKLAPTVSLILTMVFRLIPTFLSKARQIGTARKCIGKSTENGTFYEKAQHGMMIVSSLTTWALEGGVTTADSMQSRGFGSGKRTSFSICSLKKKDIVLLVWEVVLIISILGCTLQGGMDVSFFPEIEMSGWKERWTLIGMIGYVLFLSIPVGINLVEEIAWRILKSKI